MTDCFSREKRSKIMSKIRSKETSIERTVFGYLRREGIYFQKHYKKIQGNPDIALPRKKKAVFVDGDFWHGWKFKERRNSLPQGYWVEKIEKNIKRDRKNRALLRKKGWRVFKVWEHELAKKSIDNTLNRLAKFLQD